MGNHLVDNNNCRIPTVSLQEGTEKFITFLHQQKEKLGKLLTLVAHNGHSSDDKHFIRAFHHTGKLDTVKDVVAGFSDTLPIFRQKFPDMGHSQSELYSVIIGGTYQAHSASDDAAALARLSIESKITSTELSAHSKSFDSAVADVKHCDEANALYNTLDHLTAKQGQVITKSMAKKMAASGLGYGHLETVFNRDGSDGLVAVLKENFNNKPRVTKDKKIINSVIAHFQSKQSAMS